MGLQYRKQKSTVTLWVIKKRIEEKREEETQVTTFIEHVCQGLGSTLNLEEGLGGISGDEIKSQKGKNDYKHTHSTVRIHRTNT